MLSAVASVFLSPYTLSVWGCVIALSDCPLRLTTSDYNRLFFSVQLKETKGVL